MRWNPLGTAFQNTAIERFTELHLFNGLTGYGSGLFTGCTALQMVRVPSTPATLGYTMFSGCSALSSVIIPEGIRVINTGCFQNCRALTSITLPSTVKSINSSAFNACFNLTSITVLASTPPTLGSSPFNLVPATCAIYVPRDSVAAYKTADGWSARAAYIQAIQ